jgi:2-dehydropantoate 2-reductase
MSTRIVVFGAGAIGGVMAWRLARAGADVSLVGRGPTVAAIGIQGLRLCVGELDERLKVPVVDLGAGLGREPPCDLLLLTVKAQDVPGALVAAAPLISPRTTVVPLVNGLPWWLFHGVKGPHAGPIEAVDPGGRLWQSLPAGQVLGAVVHLGAEVMAPGWVRQAGDGRLTLGELDGSLSPRATALAALLDAGGLPTQVHPSIRDEVWSKLVGNGSSNPLSVVSGATLDRLFAEPGLRALVETVMLEIMALGAGLGVPHGCAGAHRRGSTPGRLSHVHVAGFRPRPAAGARRHCRRPAGAGRASADAHAHHPPGARPGPCRRAQQGSAQAPPTLMRDPNDRTG